jgi:Pyridoxamine 5'-phosphate oxidase/Protein of unknown function (DUF5131)
MDALTTPTAAPPVLYGVPAPPGELLPWAWAEQRLVAARNYWIATTRPDGRPHTRPVWGVWLPDGFWFSTGSLARHNLLTNPQIAVHLESGDQVVIVAEVFAVMAATPQHTYQVLTKRPKRARHCSAARPRCQTCGWESLRSPTPRWSGRQSSRLWWCN